MSGASSDVSGGAGATVLGVHLDELTTAKVESALRATEMSFSAMSRRDIVSRVRQLEGKAIVLVDWSEERESDRTRLCEALRAASRGDRCYVIALGGHLDQPALSRAIGGAADDVLTRPFGDGILLGRLRRGIRVMEGSSRPASPRAALQEAVRDHRTGEVVVRSGERVAFIHVQEGQIVWVHVPSLPTSMTDLAQRAGVAIDADLVADLRDECRATGANFLDVLVQWGVLDEQRAKQALRELIDERLRVALDMPEAAALFVPRYQRSTSSTFRLRVSEIPSMQREAAPAPAGAPRSSREDSESTVGEERAPAEAGWFVQEAMRTEGALYAAVLDRHSGACLFHVGAQMNAAVAWSLVSALAALGPAADEVLAVVGEQCFITRQLRHSRACALFVALSSSSTTLGFARIAIARIAAKRMSPTPLPPPHGAGPAQPQPITERSPGAARRA